MALVPVEVTRLGVDRSSSHFVVILREQGGERILPIWIGQPEAESIAIEMHRMRHERPLTHDLCRNIIVQLGATLRRVHITRVVARTYYAELHLASRDGGVTVDARPSDSIAIALRFNAPLFAEETLLGVGVVEEAEETPEGPGAGGAMPGSGEPGSGPESRPLSADELKAYLEHLRPEDFGKFQP